MNTLDPIFLSHFVSKIFASDLPEVVSPLGWWMNNSIFNHRKYLFTYLLSRLSILGDMDLPCGLTIIIINTSIGILI